MSHARTESPPRQPWPRLTDVERDVRALTAAEHRFGVGAGCDILALVTVGAGIGFGLVVGGKVVAGHSGRAGQLGHLIVDSSGPECDHGHRGCANMYLPSANIVRATGHQEIDYVAAVELARAHDAATLRAFDDAGRALGVIIGAIADALDPPVP